MWRYYQFNLCPRWWVLFAPQGEVWHILPVLIATNIQKHYQFAWTNIKWAYAPTDGHPRLCSIKWGGVVNLVGTKAPVTYFMGARRQLQTRNGNELRIVLEIVLTPEDRQSTAVDTSPNETAACSWFILLLHVTFISKTCIWRCGNEVLGNIRFTIHESIRSLFNYNSFFFCGTCHHSIYAKKRQIHIFFVVLFKIKRPQDATTTTTTIPDCLPLFRYQALSPRWL